MRKGADASPLSPSDQQTTAPDTSSPASPNDGVVCATLDPLDLSKRGVALFKQKSFAAALELFDQMLQSAEDSSGIDEGEGNLSRPLTREERCAGLCNRAAACLQLLDWQRALRDAEDCLQLDPGRARALKRKTDALVGLGRWEEAGASLLAAVGRGEARSAAEEQLLERETLGLLAKVEQRLENASDDEQESSGGRSGGTGAGGEQGVNTSSARVWRAPLLM